MEHIKKHVFELKGSDLPKKLRGNDIASTDLVRVTVETIKAVPPPEEMSVLGFLEAADRYEGTRGDGLDVAPLIRSLRGEWD